MLVSLSGAGHLTRLRAAEMTAMPTRRVGRSSPVPRPWSRRLRQHRAERQAPNDRRRRDWAAWLGVTTAVIAAIGALVFNAVSAIATNRQIEQGQQGQLTERYSKAVEQLGSDSIDVRLGGIYALERLMRDSPTDQPTIVEVLAAFVRDNANKRPSPNPSQMPSATPDLRAALGQRPADILAAVTVLGRRDTRHDMSKHPVDLSFANFAGLNLIAVNMTGMDLKFASLNGAVLNGANLTSAILAGADLTHARLRAADLTCAVLWNANLTGADLSGANLTHVDMSFDVVLTGANLDEANLSGANLGNNNLSGTTGTPRPKQSSSTAAPRCND